MRLRLLSSTFCVCLLLVLVGALIVQAQTQGLSERNSSWERRNVIRLPGDDDSSDDEANDEGSDCPAVNEDALLVASDGAEFDRFGEAVAVSSDRIVVGARQDDDNGNDSGSAYVYVRGGPCGSTWCEEAKLLASDGEYLESYGDSVAIDGDRIVVGAPADRDNGYLSGSAYVYRFDGTSWHEKQKLLPSDGTFGDRFGYTVGISGDVTILSGYGDLYNGSAYIFRFDGVSWVEEQKLLASDGAANDFFGEAVAISGDVAIVGASADDDNADYSGSAYVYRFDGISWVEEQKLLACDGSEGAGDEFGFSVAVSGDTIVVGANYDDHQEFNSGSAYRFVRGATCGSEWCQEAKLLASDGAYNARLGVSVAVSGDTAVAGANFQAANWNGAAYVFELQSADDEDEDGSGGSSRIFERNWNLPSNGTADLEPR